MVNIFDSFAKDKKNVIFLLFIPIVLYMIKISNENDLRWEQYGKKRWSRKIFNYLREDNDFVEDLNEDKILFYKKKTSNTDRINLCGKDEFSQININTHIPELQYYCNDKKKFLYVVSSDYTPLTIFIDFYNEEESKLKFKKYIFKDKQYLEKDFLIDSDNIPVIERNINQENEKMIISKDTDNLLFRVFLYLIKKSKLQK